MDTNETNKDLTFRLMNGDLIKIPYEDYKFHYYVDPNEDKLIVELPYIRIQKYIVSVLENKPKTYKSIVLLDSDGNKISRETETDWNPNMLYSVYVDSFIDQSANVISILSGINFLL